MTEVQQMTAIRKLINNRAVREFDVEELMDLFDINPDDGEPWAVCERLTAILIDMELSEEERKRAKFMFRTMAANLADFICDNVI